VISTTRTSTFEEEINQAAAEGYRIVPQTGAALQEDSLFTGTYGYEQAIVMEKVPELPKVLYLLLGAGREGTIQRELNAAPATCDINTMFLSYQFPDLVLAGFSVNIPLQFQWSLKRVIAVRPPVRRRLST
jgi:hypothetical protein